MNRVQAVGISHRGKVRPNNEDRYLIYRDESLAVYAVADGMGGHAAGEVASTLALDAVESYWTAHRQELLDACAAGKTVRPLLNDMLARANASVLDAGTSKEEYAGMGTTLTLLATVCDQHWLAHIGDSRAYLLRNKNISLITEDHTLVSQLVRSGQISEDERNIHPQRNILTRALGTDNVADFDLRQIVVECGDRLLLCSDGLYGMVSDEEIQERIMQEKEAAQILEELVVLANAYGGTDNITVVLIDTI
ncbi:MAG: Stp1/IreP family PP2C-type Ser/Thr phosphatase [Firmicutes bacterium]|nr:Stp1/IreP family PP2C-type Ser/Thr phosphatase [Bacillota bacterium]